MENLSFPVSRKSRVLTCSELSEQNPEVDILRPVFPGNKVKKDLTEQGVEFLLILQA